MLIARADDSVLPNGDFEQADPAHSGKALHWDLTDGLGVQWTHAPTVPGAPSHGKAIRMEIADNGRSFPVRKTLLQDNQRLGLVGMKERMEMVGGSLVIVSLLATLALASEGLIRLAVDTEYATPTEALMGHRAKYAVEIQQALTFIKPSFNEEMRGGHTNM